MSGARLRRLRFTRRGLAWWLFLLGALLLCLPDDDPTAAGRRAHAEGDPVAALAAFERARQAAGATASAALQFDLALAAHRAGQPERAARAARVAAERGGGPGAGEAYFLLGQLAFVRSEAAEAEAQKPGADARAFQWAIALTEDALTAWRQAARTRLDWPAARRNVERALLRLERLRERKQAGAKGSPPAGKPKTGPKQPSGEPPEGPKPPAPRRVGRDDPDTAIATADLPAAKVLGLLVLLQQKEQAKRALRRALRRARAAQVDRDW